MSMSVAVPAWVSGRHWVDVFIVIAVLLLTVGILQDLIAHVCKLGIRGFRLRRARTRSRLVFPNATLHVDLRRPLFHFSLAGEADNEVLNAWVAFPENLTCI